MQAVTQIAIDAPIETVFEVVWDVARYPDFLSDVVNTEVLPGPNEREISAHFQVKLLRVRAYQLHMVAEPPRQIRWTLERGDSLVRNDGAWELEPHPSGLGCVARYQVDIDFALAVPDAIVRKMVEYHMPVMLRQFKARAEQVWRSRST